MKDLLVTACGAVTSIVTAIILVVIEQVFGFSFYTWTFWFVLPLGALLSGFAASTGYLWGARLLNHRPGRIMLVSMVGVAVATFFLVHYFSYLGAAVDGAPLSASMSFGEYLHAVITHSSMSFRFHAAKLGSTGELGGWGYLFAVLQILGFAAGGFVVYEYVRGLPFCGACSRYLKRTSKVRRFSDNPDDMQALGATIAPLLTAGRLTEASSAHARFGVEKAGKLRLRTEMTVWQCKGCTKRLVRFGAAKKSGNDFKDIPELKQEGTSQSPVMRVRTIG